MARKKKVKKIYLPKESSVQPLNKLAGAEFKKICREYTVSNLLFNHPVTRYDLSSIVITYPFYAKIKTTRNKQYYPVIFGNNHEIVFTGETHKNKNDIIQLLKSWFPQVVIK